MFGVAGGNNAKTVRQANAEKLALRIFEQADGAPVTRATVDDQLTRWRSHPPACRCAAPCDLAATVSTSRVWCVLWAWQASIARTRRLAQR
jgi:hypothetical protein